MQDVQKDAEAKRHLGLTNRQWIRMVAVSTVFGLVCGVAIGWVASKATGAVPDDRLAGVSLKMCPPEYGCPPRARKAQRDWRAGRFGRTHGFSPRRWFVHPVKMNRLIIRRMDRWLDLHPRRARAITSIYHRRTPAGRLNPEFRRTCASYPATCLYEDHTSAAPCVGNKPYSPYPASGSGTQCQRVAPRNGKLTDDQVAAGLIFSGCQAAGAINFMIALPKRGRPWMALLAGGIAEANCFLAGWAVLR